MTAEIAILNREAVAIAADSAATFKAGTSQKIFSSANKIFALSKHHPIGIMVYGNALFMGVPWETIIKVYRKKLGDSRFNTLYDYSQNFIEFLKNDLNLFPEKEQEKYVKSSIYGFFYEVKKGIIESIKEQIESKGKIDEKDIIKKTDNILSLTLEKWKNGYCNITEADKHLAELQVKYKKIIDKATIEVFEKLPLSLQAKKLLKEIACYLFISFPKGIMNTGISGVVVSGFGEEEIFPSLVALSIEGMANNILKFKEDQYTKVDYENSAIIIPFAQKEMVATFIEGISPLFNNMYDRILKETVENYPKVIIENIAPDMNASQKEELLKKIQKVSLNNLKKGLQKVNEIQNKHFINPILKVVTFLPKNEIAEMAESLVNLTCLRKKISMDDETVGGPIDVAVISKGDGLVWIKRKHYFNPELNKHFFVNYLNK
jgi:hypothetical protein